MIRALSAPDIIRVWELGQDKPSWHRALLLLAPALPQMTRDALAALSVGRRNAHLFALRERLLGPTMDAFVACPTCQESLEFPVEVDELCEGYVPPPLDAEYTLEEAGIALRYRLLNSHDLATGARRESLGDERQRLVGCCVLEARQGEQALGVADLPEAVVTVLAEHVAERDPLADARLMLACAACGHTWAAPFDIVSFLWAELTLLARRLLDEVHVLASAYGWREADILAMSDARRQYYLEKVV